MVIGVDALHSGASGKSALVARHAALTLKERLKDPALKAAIEVIDRKQQPPEPESLGYRLSRLVGKTITFPLKTLAYWCLGTTTAAVLAVGGFCCYKGISSWEKFKQELWGEARPHVVELGNTVADRASELLRQNMMNPESAQPASGGTIPDGFIGRFTDNVFNDIRTVPGYYEAWVRRGSTKGGQRLLGCIFGEHYDPNADPADLESRVTAPIAPPENLTQMSNDDIFWRYSFDVGIGSFNYALTALETRPAQNTAEMAAVLDNRFEQLLAFAQSDAGNRDARLEQLLHVLERFGHSFYTLIGQPTIERNAQRLGNRVLLANEAVYVWCDGTTFELMATTYAARKAPRALRELEGVDIEIAGAGLRFEPQNPLQPSVVGDVTARKEFLWGLFSGQQTASLSDLAHIMLNGQEPRPESGRQDYVRTQHLGDVYMQEAMFWTLRSKNSELSQPQRERSSHLAAAHRERACAFYTDAAVACPMPGYARVLNTNADSAQRGELHRIMLLSMSTNDRFEYESLLTRYEEALGIEH